MRLIYSCVEKISELVDFRKKIEETIDDLPSIHRQILRLRYIEQKGWGMLQKNSTTARRGFYSCTMRRWGKLGTFFQRTKGGDYLK